MIHYNSPSQLRAVLEGQGLALKKRFGQNFLINGAVRGRIVQALGPLEGRRVWEIGAGLGCMTGLLLEGGALVTAFEIDRGFMRVLKHEYASFVEGSRLRLIEGDVRNTSRGEALPDIVMGNLPYSSGALIVAEFLERGFVPGRMVFLLQREVARRLCARPAEGEYSSLSLLCQSWCSASVLFDVGPASFYPAPKVVSSAILLDRLVRPDIAPSPEPFAALIRTLFAARRKTIRNNLLAMTRGRPDGQELVMLACREADVDPAGRAERLGPAQTARLSRALYALLEVRSGTGPRASFS